MKVSPVASPHQIIPTGASNPSSATDARERAIQRLTQSTPVAHVQPQQNIVSNQNAISPEEMGAIRAPSDSQVSSESQDMAPQEAPEGQEVEAQQEQKPQVDPAFSRQFAQLARQEKALRAQQQAIKAKEAALAVREAEFTKTPAAPQLDLTMYSDRERFKQDPLSILDETGVSYEELTQQIINRQPTDPRVMNTIQRQESRIAQLEKMIEDSNKSYKDSQTQAYQAAVKQIKVDAKNLIHSDPAYETVKVTGSIDDVVELITRTYDEDGVLLTVDEAAQQVEDYLVEEATKLARIDKIQKRLQANSNKPAPAPVQQKQPAPKLEQPQMKTLTNNTASTRKLTAKERAILAFKGELKS